MAHEGIFEFNRECGERYYFQTYGITLSEPSKNCPGNSRHCHRSIAVLLDYQNSGTIYRRRLSKDHTFDESFQPAIGEFMTFVGESMARTSRRQIRSRMESFLGFLIGRGCTDLAKLNRQTILDYWKSPSHVCRTTQVYDRLGFNMMMRDAMEGKIDLIITKAVSRFARNLIDCINWVRLLQKHDPPIAVFFEQENLNTLDNTSNIILFVLAMVAEEESHIKSEAMLLSLEWRFSRGRFLTPPLLGYDKVEMVDKDGIKKKMLVVNEEQAVIVRYMYYSLLNGASPAEIAENLTAMGLETGGRKKDGTPNTHWSASGVVSTLRNERYCGDVLARKTWTPDFHDHKSKKNNGKKNKYYHPGHHEAIVTRAQWNAAQKILNSFRYCHSGSYKPMQVVEEGALCGYISINRGWL